MNVVYPYRLNESDELYYSIKSVKKHVKHAKIFIIGDEPTFKTKAKVIQPLDNEWAKFSPYHDVINKLLTACDLGDEFILMNDDFFIMEPMREAPSFNRGTMLDHLNQRRYDTYTRALRNTRNLLAEKGYNQMDYELHAPMLINSDMMRMAIEEILPQLRFSKSILIRSYYGNKWGIISEHSGDFKNPDDYKDLPFISTNEVTFAGEIGNYIKEKLS